MGSSNAFVGVIDEVRIYRGALTAAEVVKRIAEPEADSDRAQLVLDCSLIKAWPTINRDRTTMVRLMVRERLTECLDKACSFEAHAVNRIKGLSCSILGTKVCHCLCEEWSRQAKRCSSLVHLI